MIRCYFKNHLVRCSGGLTTEQCKDVYTDSNHCGACRNKCPSNRTCTDATCVLVPCGPTKQPCANGEYCSNDLCCKVGFTNCGGKCVDFKNDPKNCGKCGQVCTSSQTCLSGNCCNNGEVLCGGKCVNLRTNRKNCGRCGNSCSPTSGTAQSACFAGKCMIRCYFKNHLVRCSGGLTTEKCRNIYTDVNHCGACKVTCASGQSCVDAVCK